MKRPTDVAKWSGDGFTPDRVKPREAWSKRMERREREFEKAPVDTLLTMAKVAGHSLAHVAKIYNWRGSRPFTRFLAIALTDDQAATWSPENGIRVVPRRVVERAIVW